MGIDYNAIYGVGVEIDRYQEGDEEYEDLYQFLDDKLEGSKYGHSCFGDNYSNEEQEYYIEILDPFEGGPFTLFDKMQDLYDFLKDNNIKYIGKIDIFGGLDVS